MSWQSRPLGDFTDFFSIFGAAVASYITVKFALSVWQGLSTFVFTNSLGRTNLTKMGKWAVVTGATDGIGKAYAQELAKMGMDIVLISRNPEKLSDVAAEIVKTSEVETKCVAVDFTGDTEVYTKIKKELTGVDIGVLVNNVGMSYAHPEYFGDVDEQVIRNIVNVNASSVALMTKIVLPGMVEKRRGVIINISSGSALVPTPMLTLYSATKSFVNFFSQALQMEYASKGIIVQCVMPFFVATKLSKIRRANFMAPSPRDFVRSALQTVGVERCTFGCLSHALQAYVISRAPVSIIHRMTMKQMKAVRNKALKQAEKNN